MEENLPCQPVTPCQRFHEEVAAPTLTSDRVCQPCEGATHYFDTDLGRCAPVSFCPPGAEVEDATVTSDRKCSAAPIRCEDGITTSTGEGCSCPDDAVCQQCYLQEGLDATLRMLDELPQGATSLGACQRIAAGDTDSLYATCFEECIGNPQCVAFDAQRGSMQCCLYSSVGSGIASTHSSPGAAFYTPPQCDACAQGYYKLGRRCYKYADPPAVEGGLTQRVLQIPLSTPVGTPLFRISAAAEPGFGPPRFSIDTPLLHVNASGAVSMAQALVGAEAISATVTILDHRASCVLRDGGTGLPILKQGPCEVQMPLVIRVAVFLSCPSTVNTYVPLDKNAANVAWPEPRLPPFLGDLNVTVDLGDPLVASPPYRYGLGRRRVVYATPPLSIGGRIECAFDVIVRHGASVSVTSIGRLLSQQRAREFFVVELGATNDGARLPAILGHLGPSQNLSLGLLPPVGKPFAITPPSGLQSTIEIDLRWCRAGSSSGGATELTLGELDVVLVAVSGATPLTFEDLGSGVSSDGSCVQMRARSSAITQPLLFLEMVITLRQQTNALPRRRRSTGPAYLPVSHYHVGVVTRAPNGDELILPGGEEELWATALEDTQPPIYLNCPGEAIVVQATDRQLTATATWEEIAAVDSIVPTVNVTGSHLSGAAFSILGSPHRVTFLASDGVQTARCAFNVIVNYQPMLATFSDELNTTFPTRLYQRPSRHTTSIWQALVGDGANVAAVLRTLDMGEFTELRVELSAPDGQPVALRTRSEAFRSQLVVQLAWARIGRDPLLPTPGAQDDVGVKLEFIGLRAEHSREVDELSAEEQAIRLQQSNKFRSGSAAIDPDTGYIGVRDAYTLPFRRGVIFQTMVLVFQVPRGRNTSFGASNYELLPGRGIWAEYEFDYKSDAEAVSGFVALEDTQAPIFTVCPIKGIRVPTEAGENFAQPNWPLPVAEDNSGRLQLTSTAAPRDRFELPMPNDGPALVTYSAVDEFGNAANCSFGVVVVDEEAPTLMMPADFEIELSAAPRSQTVHVPLQAISPLNVTDNSRMPVMTHSPRTDVELGVGRHTLLANVSDAWGNLALESMVVTVLDKTPPTIVCPIDLRVPAPKSLTDKVSVSWTRPTFDDNDYDGNPDGDKLGLQLSVVSGSDFVIGTKTITATVTDRSGLSASCSFNVTVEEPTLTLGSSGEEQASSAALYGGAGAGAAALVMLIAAIVLIRRSKRKRPQDWSEIFSAMEQFRDAKDGNGGPAIPREIARGHLTLLGELGKGAFGVVWKGLLKEEPKRPGYLVAAKSLHDTCTATDKQVRIQEGVIERRWQGSSKDVHLSQHHSVLTEEALHCSILSAQPYIGASGRDCHYGTIRVTLRCAACWPGHNRRTSAHGRRVRGARQPPVVHQDARHWREDASIVVWGHCRRHGACPQQRLFAS